MASAPVCCRCTAPERAGTGVAVDQHVASLNLADRLVERLIACGVTRVFGVGGANIEDVFAAVQRRRPQIGVILGKHEHGAATAASGYARIQGGLGVVLATSGGGAMNLVHALAEARASGVPLLAIVGEPPSSLQGAGAFQDTSGREGAIDAQAVLGAAAGCCLRIPEPNEALQLLDRALVHIAATSQPAVLLIAKDHQQAQYVPAERESLAPAPSVPAVSKLQLTAAAGQLNEGACVIIAGDEVARARAQTELAQLAAALDASVALAPDARDAFDNYDPRFIGVAGAMGHVRVAAALAQAKTCLAIGTRLPLLTRMGLEQRLTEMPVITLGRMAPYLVAPQHRHLACELRAGLRQLTEAVHARHLPHPQPRPAPVPAIETSQRLDTATAMRMLESAIEDESVVLVDAGNTGASAAHYLRAPRRGRWLMAMGMAGMGYAFGAAVGAAVASQRRCWVIAGDGAFFMHGLEIHTAVEHALPITYVIFDNRAHGMCLVRERLLLQQNGGYNSFRRSRLADGLGAMFPGLYARDCADIPQLRAALSELASCEGPSVISLALEDVEVPPFHAFQSIDPLAKTVPRGE